MLLTKTDDFRDCLEKATRSELAKFAAARGVTEVDPRMGAILMRQILRAKNATDIDTMFPRLRSRAIGQMNGVNATGKYATGDNRNNPAQLTAVEALARQWQEQMARDAAALAAPEATPQKPKNEMAELRAECKRRGIKMTRTDRMNDLRAKLDGG